jgi:hypothetical protein
MEKFVGAYTSRTSRSMERCMAMDRWSFMTSHLGPLEFIGGQWILGDPAPRSKHFKFQREGLSHWVNGVEAESIPWSRLMNLDLSVQPSRLGNSGALAKVTNFFLALTGMSRHGGGEAYLAATLRNPYQDWNATFTHATNRYDRREIRLTEEFFKQVVESGRTANLGDPHWVAAAVEGIASLVSDSRNAKAIVEEIVRN